MCHSSRFFSIYVQEAFYLTCNCVVESGRKKNTLQKMWFKIMILSATGMIRWATIDKKKLSTNCETQPRYFDIRRNRIFLIVRRFFRFIFRTDVPSMRGKKSENSFHSSFFSRFNLSRSPSRFFSLLLMWTFNTVSIEEEKVRHFSWVRWNDDVSSLFLMPFRIAVRPFHWYNNCCAQVFLWHFYCSLWYKEKKTQK